VTGDDELTRLLAAAETAPPTESVDVLMKELRRRFGAASVSFLVTDLLGKMMVRVVPEEDGGAWEDAERITLAGSTHARVIRTQRPHWERNTASGRYRLIVPVTNRGDSLGLLELTLPGDPDDAVMEQIGAAAHALAYIVVTDGRFTDLYQRRQRSSGVSLAAEIQYQLLPPALSCEAAQFTVAGALEPAASIGGDTFDYSLDRDTVHLSVTDAMGHDVDAALLATLLVGALREGRRADTALVEQARRAHQALLDHGRGAMATGQLLRIGLKDGRAQMVNAGHPWPLRLRGDTVEEIHLGIDLPFGVSSPHSYRVQDLDLRPGDRLIMLTDGMLERSGADVDLPALVTRTHGLHPREAVRVLASAVSGAHEGGLPDDATVMCLDWYGTGSTRRDADTGADLDQASPPQDE